MHFFTLLAPLALSLNLVAAIPTPTTNATTLYRFRTCVHPGEDASKEGLYLSSYHIGKFLTIPAS